MSSISVASVVCDDVRKEANGKHIFIGVYNDTIVFPNSEWKKNQNEIGLSKLVIANIVSGVKAGKHTIAWWLEDPDGEPFGPQEPQTGDFEFTEDNAQGIHIQISPVVFKKLGQYRFRMDIDSEPVCDKQIEVRTQDAPIAR